MSDQSDWYRDYRKHEKMGGDFTPKFTTIPVKEEVDQDWIESKRKWKERFIKTAPTHDRLCRKIIWS